MVGGVDLYTQGMRRRPSRLHRPLSRLFAGQPIRCPTCEQQAPEMVPRSTQPPRPAQWSILAAHMWAPDDRRPSNTPSAATMH